MYMFACVNAKTLFSKRRLENCTQLTRHQLILSILLDQSHIQVTYPIITVPATVHTLISTCQELR